MQRRPHQCARRRAPFRHQNEAVGQRRETPWRRHRPERRQVDDDVIERLARALDEVAHAGSGKKLAGVRQPPPYHRRNDGEPRLPVDHDGFCQGCSPTIASTSPFSGASDRLRLRPGLRRSPSISKVFTPLAASSPAKFAATVVLPSCGSTETKPMTLHGLRCRTTSPASLTLRSVSAKDEDGALIATRRMRGVAASGAGCCDGFPVRLAVAGLRALARRAADDRQVTEELDVERVAHVVAGTEKSLAEFLQGADAGAGEQAQHQRQAEHHRLARARRRHRVVGLRNHARLGDREGTLLRGFLVARQESLVECRERGRLLLQLTQPHHLTGSIASSGRLI